MTFAVGLLTTAAAGWVGPASAQPIPAAVPLTGALTELDSGEPLQGTVSVRIGLYPGEAAEAPTYEETLELELEGGRFTTYFGLEGPIDLRVFQDVALWVQIAILADEGRGLEGEVFPRFPLGTVPYAAASSLAYECRTLDGLRPGDLAPAMHRHDWSELDGVPSSIAEGVSAGDGVRVDDGRLSVDPTVFQRRIVGTCDEGLAMRAVAEDGSVVCEPVGGGGGGSYRGGPGIDVTGDVISVADDEVTAANHAWGPPLVLPFAPTSPSTSCEDDADLGGDVWGSTSSRSFEYVGSMAYDEDDSDDGVRQDYRRARLRVLCRGNGFVEVVEACGSTPVASIRCKNSDRPVTATSESFTLGSAEDYDVRVRAISRELDWAHPALVVY